MLPHQKDRADAIIMLQIQPGSMPPAPVHVISPQ